MLPISLGNIRAQHQDSTRNSKTKWDDENQILTGYGSIPEYSVTSSIFQINNEQFNIGNINDPELLIRNKVPGLGIYKKGSDPNQTPTLRIRGICSIGSKNEPLLVIDGVMGASLENVDPNDIESYTILKDGAAASIYGMRASAGVILITTKTGKRNTGITANYHSYIAAAKLINQLPSMQPSEFVNSGGNDLGYQTNWLDEVSQSGYTLTHNVVISGGEENTVYRFSFNSRDVEGILNSSGFKQVNTRANITRFMANDRLKIGFNMSLTNRESNFAFREAFRYATVYNPTSPIAFDNGNYAQAIIFDNFNPVAIINQNQNVGKSKILNYHISASYKIFDQFSLSASFGQQQSYHLNGEFYPNYSFFRGILNDGLASRSIKDSHQELFESFLTYKSKGKKHNLSLVSGYSYQETFHESLSLSLDNFPSNKLGFYGIDQSASRVLGLSENLLLDASATPIEKVIAFFGRVNLVLNESIFLNAAIRREGSTRLGVNKKWGTFPSIGTGININHYLNLPHFSQLKLRVSYGVTGNLPIQYGYAQNEYKYNFINGGTVENVRVGNPDLKWEQKNEYNLGLDFGLFKGKVKGTIEFFERNLTDLILEMQINDQEYRSNSRYENFGHIHTSGFEFSLNQKILAESRFSWQTALVVSHFKSILNKYNFHYDQTAETRAYLGAPGQGASTFIRIAQGEELGQFWGPIFEGVDKDGYPLFKDVNGDGTIIASTGSALEKESDFTKLGNGFPSMEFGLTNQLSYNKIDFTTFFRGALGHSLINTFRVFYESFDQSAINSYNRVITEKAEANLVAASYSSLYVEKSNFLRLDNITIGYSFKDKDRGVIKKLRWYGTIQNAFTITRYSGTDPEPVLADFGPVDNGAYLKTNADPMAPGIDRRNFYYTARSYIIGLSIEF
jgi:TonB-linked SusC/RagA family outer membrane protein